MSKSTVDLINSNKNKLNNEIILIYNSFPNARLMVVIVFFKFDERGNFGL